LGIRGTAPALFNERLASKVDFLVRNSLADNMTTVDLVIAEADPYYEVFSIYSSNTTGTGSTGYTGASGSTGSPGYQLLIDVSPTENSALFTGLRVVTIDIPSTTTGSFDFWVVNRTTPAEINGTTVSWSNVNILFTNSGNPIQNPVFTQLVPPRNINQLEGLGASARPVNAVLVSSFTPQYPNMTNPLTSPIGQNMISIGNSGDLLKVYVVNGIITKILN